jgi:hypothetical protein
VVVVRYGMCILFLHICAFVRYPRKASILNQSKLQNKNKIRIRNFQIDFLLIAQLKLVVCDGPEKVTELLNTNSNIKYAVSFEDLNESTRSLAICKGVELFTFEEAKSIGRLRLTEPYVGLILHLSLLF